LASRLRRRCIEFLEDASRNVSGRDASANQCPRTGALEAFVAVRRGHGALELGENRAKNPEC
jgi:hypothetical protein